ncbi:MAG: hypothetical protein Ta2G_11240 [Termitinemataceae bacterium]|nr:MAG: hypothetical protein Ta2G_11240 [Termitinemataceae bacterium]
MSLFAKIEVGKQETEFNFVNKYDRVFEYTGALAGAYSLILNNFAEIGTALSFGGNSIYTEINTTLQMELNFGFFKPVWFKLLNFKVLGTYQNIEQFYLSSLSTITVVSIKGRLGGFSLGYHATWSSFFYEQFIFEGGLAFNGYINVFNLKYFALNISAANYDLFYTTAYYGDYYLSFNTTCKINERIEIKNDLSFFQSGSVGMSSNFYGVSLRSGVKISW